MKITVDTEDIFRYAVGDTTQDPIESQIDLENRYEVFDSLIYDHRKKKFIKQSEAFSIFSKGVSDLRRNASSMILRDITDECLRLSKLDFDVELS